MSSRGPIRFRGFSLLEVVAAVGLFAIGIVVILGLFAPVTKSVAHVSEAETAARLADGIRARLQSMPLPAALALIQDPVAVANRERDAPQPNHNPATLFATASGEIALYDATAGRWLVPDYSRSPASLVPLNDAAKFFAIDLVRNETLSPQAADDSAAVVAFTVRVRWPVFVPAPIPDAPVARGGQQALFFAGTLSR